ncbi:hypothetical protein LTR56_026225 [Elasticomyces elasticus]|nr:hypothetical protein LTR56_026225 [Elasticomyces elasticus]KAK3619601.1 hypothetical protein LTR22_025929 [Elasticomyces elasticus]KAK4903565.1 hypothetical protein LTR49_026818 [Elasticomyces elasticus]KAK5732213.1 hypothetical protein LTS12_027156 [Elasticomyces elasticus]
MAECLLFFCSPSSPSSLEPHPRAKAQSCIAVKRVDSTQILLLGLGDIVDPSFGTAIATGHQGPMASYENHVLVGRVDLLYSGQINICGLSKYTSPLYQSSLLSNETYWWIVTGSSDEVNAQQLEFNYSPKSRFAAQGRTLDGLTGAEEVRIANNTVGGRRGLVDFSPVRDIVPGHPSPFPPSHVHTGSVGDRFYTPLIQLTNGGGEIWNAPIVASDVIEEYVNQFCDDIPPEMLEDFRSKVHDQVLAICPREQTVTLATVHGFAFGKSVLYLIANGSDP